MSSSEFIPELGRELSGRSLDIWNGTAVGIDTTTMARYRVKWLSTPLVSPSKSIQRVEAVPASTLCIHAGDLLPGRRRQELGLFHSCFWRPCGHVEKPKGEYVCPKRGCGISCSGYSPGEEEDPLS